MRTLPLLLVLGLATHPASQEPPTRANLAGRVLGLDDQPMAGATVVLSALTTPGLPLLGEVDVVEATANERGIFRAQVLPGLGYTAWAWLAAPDGTYRRTAEDHGVVPGDLFTLREIDPQSIRRIRVRTHAEWQDLAPFTLRITKLRPGVAPVDCTTDEHGELAAPPLRPEPCVLTVLDRRGEPLIQEGFCDAPEQPGPEVLGIERPHARSIPVLVTDQAGEPLAGAAIRVRFDDVWVPPGSGDLLLHSRHSDWSLQGTTDADGRLEVRLPLRFAAFPGEDPGARLILSATAAGCMQAYSGSYDGAVFWNGRLRTETVDELRFTLPPARPLTGRVMATRDLPVADAPILVQAFHRIETRQDVWTYEEVDFRTRTDAEGRFAIPEAPDDVDRFKWTVRLPADARSDPDAPRMALLRARHSRELGTVDLSKLKPARVRVTDDRGEPALTTQLRIFESPGKLGIGEDLPWLTRIGRTGTAHLLVEPGPYLVLAAGPRGMAHGTLQAARFAWSAPELELTLQPWPTLRLQVVRGDGSHPDRVTVKLHEFHDPDIGDLAADAAFNALLGLCTHLAASAEYDEGVLEVRCPPGLEGHWSIEILTPELDRREVPVLPVDGEPMELVIGGTR